MYCEKVLEHGTLNYDSAPWKFSREFFPFIFRKLNFVNSVNDLGSRIFYILLKEVPLGHVYCEKVSERSILKYGP